MIIVSLRGAHPISVRHAAQGSCPGIGVVTLNEDRTDGELTHVFRTFLSDYTGTKNLSDIHMAVVRIKGAELSLRMRFPDSMQGSCSCPLHRVWASDDFAGRAWLACVDWRAAMRGVSIRSADTTLIGE